MIERLETEISEYSVRNKKDEDIPVYSVTNDRGFCTGYFSKDVSSKDRTTYKIVPYGYFAYNPSRVNVGSIDWQKCTERVIVSPLYVVFRVSERLYPQYLLHYLKSDIALSYIRAYATGSVRDNLTLSALAKLPIRIIPIDNQRIIADVLDRIDRICELRRSEASLLDNLIKSRFIELFGKGNDNRFSTKTLPQIISSDRHALKRGPFGGSLIKDDFVETGCLVYEQRHAIHNDFDYEKYYITPQKYQDMIMFRVLPGDLIVSCSGVTLGRIAEVPANAKKGIINQALLKITLDHKIMNNTFFIHQFRSDRIQDVLFGFCRGSGIPNFPSMNEVKAVHFICPPLDLQEQFAAFVDQTDKSRLAVQEALDKLKLLKQALVQQYFS